ncbi:MAG: glycosyltransferase [Candidatus Heimdallarchaeaceae archaeon]
MSNEKGRKINHFVGMLLYIGILVYFITSLVSLFIHLSDLKAHGFILNLLALLFETLGPLYAIYFMIQLIDGILNVGEINYSIDKLSEFPKVTVIIPIHNVNPVILKDTLLGFKNQNYPNFELWVGDDSTDAKLREECKKITEENGFIYFYRENDRFKAHMVNMILEQPQVKESKYVAFFDVDHIPEPNILKKFVAILEQHPEFVFVQGKFGFRNAKNYLHVWEAMSLTQMFASQNARRKTGNVLFCGSTACFRRDILKGLPEGTLTEDYDLTIRLASEGYRGYWLDEISSMSLVPENIGHQMSQLDRWMKGQAGALSDHIGKLFRSKMTFKQAIDFVVSSTVVLVATSFYFLGIFYALIYGFKLPIYRALGLDAFSLIIMPILTLIIYISTLTATTIYTAKSGTYPLKWWHVPFFLTFGGMTAPFLVFPVIKGLFRKNKLIPGKTKWNKKIPLIPLSIFFSLIGVVFVGLTASSILDFLAITNWYGYNYFFILFGIIGITLIFAFPFIVVSKIMFKAQNYEEVMIYH